MFTFSDLLGHKISFKTCIARAAEGISQIEDGGGAEPFVRVFDGKNER